MKQAFLEIIENKWAHFFFAERCFFAHLCFSWVSSIVALQIICSCGCGLSLCLDVLMLPVAEDYISTLLCHVVSVWWCHCSQIFHHSQAAWMKRVCEWEFVMCKTELHKGSAIFHWSSLEALTVWVSVILVNNVLERTPEHASVHTHVGISLYFHFSVFSSL